MKLANTVNQISAAHSATVVQKNKIPLGIKLFLSAFLAILIPTYCHNYGPTNFLYFCDVAIILTTIGVWLESSLLVSMCSVGILLPQFLWLVDFGCNLFGFHLTGMTNYMFNPSLPLFTRGLSLFHGWLPLLLVWLLTRVGYDRRALGSWSFLAGVLVLVCYLCMPAASAHLGKPNTPVNINYVYGFNDNEPQHWVNQNLFVGLWYSFLVSVVFIPTHLVLRKICQPVTVSR